MSNQEFLAVWNALFCGWLIWSVCAFMAPLAFYGSKTWVQVVAQGVSAVVGIFAGWTAYLAMVAP